MAGCWVESLELLQCMKQSHLVADVVSYNVARLESIFKQFSISFQSVFNQFSSFEISLG